jgi:spore maturation protein CgeB
VLTIIYSFNKRGFEADYWRREIEGASSDEYRFVAFNHDPYVEPGLYSRAQLLDNLYFAAHPGLERMYRDFQELIASSAADAVIVDNYPPYHPDFLRRLTIYKVLRIADGPLSAYDRDIPYAHAYDHVLYHSPAYSRDMGMAEKLAYVGVRRADFWPLALFDAAFDPAVTEEELFSRERDIDVVFIGALHVNKMPLLATVKKAFGRRCIMHGLTSLKKNVYFNLKYGFPQWMQPVPFEAYVPLYQRARIGFNVHNRGDYTVGSYRLFDLPGNGVMQISDGGDYLASFFRVGDEIIGYRTADELVDRIRFYLARNEERLRIARNGYRRVLADHRIRHRLHQAASLVRDGMGGRSS